jgi:hypothetical protein
MNDKNIFPLILRSAGRLGFIHLSALAAVMAAMYFPEPVGVIFSLLYLAVIYREGCRLYFVLHGRLAATALTACLWQLPGLILAAVYILDLSSWGGIYYYSFFMLEIWQTQHQPLLSLLPLTGSEHPLYYYLYFADVPLLMLWLLLPGFREWRAARRRWFYPPGKKR